MSYVSSIELRKVRPEAIHEKSVVESVVDLFHDVVEKVPQGHKISTRQNNSDQLEPIEWLYFLRDAHIWHSSIRPDTLALFVAYKSGLTLWIIEPNGIANELFSIREHNICSACLLTINPKSEQIYLNQRPLLALAKSAGPPSIQIRSLKNDQHIVKTIQLPGTGLQSEPLSIESNDSLLICATHTFISGYDLVKFSEKFFISNCYSSLPFSLSTRWLAFADHRLYTIHQSLGGINSSISEQNLSYTGAVLNVAKSFSKSFAKLGESVFNFGINGVSSSGANPSDKSYLGNSTNAVNPGNHTAMPVASTSSTNIGNSNGTRHRLGSGKDESQPGIVTIVDTIKLFGSTIHDENQNWIVAHFQAHSEPIGHLHFNPSGHLLVTCDTSGHYFNVLEIQASPYRCTRTFIKHLYTLFRGDTDCRVSHMTFTQDSRWLAVSSKRGTTHIFAIHPYGGVVNVHTHTKTHVVNRPNRTPGFDEPTIRSFNVAQHENASRDSSSTSALTNISSNHMNVQTKQFNPVRTKRSQNDCLFLQAVTLIRQPTDSFVSGLSAPFNIDSICLATIFGTSRGFLNPEDMSVHQDYAPKACNSIFIVSWHGRLIEYVLEPMPDTSKHGTRVTPETSIILKALPRAQWQLQRLMTWPEVHMSLGYSFLSQGHRLSSSKKAYSKDDWLRQVEMNTHGGPQRRLWMGPQFQFKHYSEATVSVCHPDSNIFTADSPQTSMNVVDADLKSLPIHCSKSIPVHLPDMNKDVAPAYIEVGSGSFQDAPSLSVYGSSLDSNKSDYEIELIEKLADAAIDIPLRNSRSGDTTDSLSSSAGSSTVARPLQGHNSLEHMMTFIDNADPTD